MRKVMAGMDLHGNNVMMWACFDKTDREKGGIG
jgi:hypothetical protein